MTTKYTAKIKEFLSGEQSKEEMSNWIQAQPLLDQPDIFREFNTIAKKKFDKVGFKDYDFELMDNLTEEYEDKILDGKLAEANYVMAEQELDKTMKEVDEARVGIRRYVMDCIINKEDNAIPMLELAHKIIELEKKDDLYDENNWKEILHLIKK